METKDHVGWENIPHFKWYKKTFEWYKWYKKTIEGLLKRTRCTNMYKANKTTS